MLTVYTFSGDPAQAETLPAPDGADPRRPESRIWRGLLRFALQEAGLPGNACQVTLSPAGRPYLPGSPLDFSPTHTAGLVALAVLFRGGRVGLDAETKKRRDISRLIRAAARWFSPAEQEAVRKALCAGPDAAEDAFLQIWTAKEALVKRSGTGLQGMRLVDSTAPADCALRTFRIGETFLTVAAEQDVIGSCRLQPVQIADGTIRPLLI